MLIAGPELIFLLFSNIKAELGDHHEGRIEFWLMIIICADDYVSCTRYPFAKSQYTEKC